MYLEERVARVEAFMELFLSEHPDMCPHQWWTDGSAYKDEKGNHKIGVYCKFCGKREERIDPSKKQIRLQALVSHFEERDNGK